MLGCAGFTDKSRTSKAKKERENYGDRIKPEEIESKMFSDLRAQHDLYLHRGPKNASKSRDKSPSPSPLRDPSKSKLKTKTQ